MVLSKSPGIFKIGQEFITEKKFDGLYLENLKDGVFEGKVQIFYDNGDEYEGEVQNEKKHGEGKFRSFRGWTYEGSWVNDQRSGVGCEERL